MVLSAFLGALAVLAATPAATEAMGAWAPQGVIRLETIQAAPLEGPSPHCDAQNRATTLCTAVEASLESKAGEPPRYKLTKIREPFLLPVLPEGDIEGVVLIIPGGGYRQVSIDGTGLAIAERFAAEGVASFVLAYRLPSEGWSEGWAAPLCDAQKAFSHVAQWASSYALGSEEVGVFGSSAGGHLAGLMATAREHACPGANAKQTGLPRPSFLGLLYPVTAMDGPFHHQGSRHRLLGAMDDEQAARAFSIHRRITAQTPPAFVIHMADDKVVPIENSLLLFDAFRTAGVALEAHFYAEGGHGFGVRLPNDNPAAGWPQHFLNWRKKLPD